MKYIIQIFTICLPFVLWMITKASGPLSIPAVLIFMKKISLVFYLISGTITLFLYVYLVGVEVIRRKCYTLAQYICIFFTIVSYSYAWIIYNWLFLRWSDGQDLYDLFFTLADIANAWVIALTGQFILMVLGRKWILPYPINLKLPRMLGEILKDTGKVTDEDIENAIKKQKEEESKQ